MPEVKLCISCRYREQGRMFTPCAVCDTDKNQWAPRIAEEKRDCTTCCYEGKEVNEKPCSTCVMGGSWLPVDVVNTSLTAWVAHEEKYLPLREVLNRAYDHAAAGKGAERHATGQGFAAQPMQTISDLVGDNHGCLFQAIKKCQESTRLPKDRAVNELLGAINYLAGAVIFLEKGK